MKAASATVMAISQGLTLGFQATVTPGCGFAISVGTAPLPFVDGDVFSKSGKNFSSGNCLQVREGRVSRKIHAGCDPDVPNQLFKPA